MREFTRATINLLPFVVRESLDEMFKDYFNHVEFNYHNLMNSKGVHGVKLAETLKELGLTEKLIFPFAENYMPFIITEECTVTFDTETKVPLFYSAPEGKFEYEAIRMVYVEGKLEKKIYDAYDHTLVVDLYSDQSRLHTCAGPGNEITEVFYDYEYDDSGRVIGISTTTCNETIPLVALKYSEEGGYTVTTTISSKDTVLLSETILVKK